MNVFWVVSFYTYFNFEKTRNDQKVFNDTNYFKIKVISNNRLKIRSLKNIFGVLNDMNKIKGDILINFYQKIKDKTKHLVHLSDHVKGLNVTKPNFRKII